MKISILMDDINKNPMLESEHGLSIFVETQSKNILFDFGSTDLFLKNAEKMNIDLSKVDFCVLSHGHYDHGGGIEYFVKKYPNTKIYASNLAFEPHCRGERNIGVEKKNGVNFIQVTKPIEVCENIKIFPCRDNGEFPRYNGTLSKKVNDKIVPDDFNHEIYMQIEENGKKILFSGCSHRGILNIAKTYSPDILIGGFHLMELDCQDEKDKEIIFNIARELKKTNAKFYTCHCTGKDGFELMKQILGESLNYLSTGTVEIIK